VSLVQTGVLVEALVDDFEVLAEFDGTVDVEVAGTAGLVPEATGSARAERRSCEG
jgi:hypothetical protein